MRTRTATSPAKATARSATRSARSASASVSWAGTSVHNRLHQDAEDPQEIGKRWGCSREQVRQVELKTKQYLHRSLESVESVETGEIGGARKPPLGPAGIRLVRPTPPRGVRLSLAEPPATGRSPRDACQKGRGVRTDRTWDASGPGAAGPRGRGGYPGLGWEARRAAGCSCSARRRRTARRLRAGPRTEVAAARAAAVGRASRRGWPGPRPRSPGARTSETGSWPGARAAHRARRGDGRADPDPGGAARGGRPGLGRAGARRAPQWPAGEPANEPGRRGGPPGRSGAGADALSRRERADDASPSTRTSRRAR